MMGGLTAAPLFEPKIGFLNTMTAIVIVYRPQGNALPRGADGQEICQMAQQITDPKLQTMLKGMEQATRNHYGAISQTMGSLGIV